MAVESHLSIVIVNWNSGRQLLECIKSVLDNGLCLVTQIVVVDNGSSDGSEAAVEGLPKVTLLRAGENLGFAKACNRGASLTNSEFLLFLNPDTRIFSDTLPVALDFMQCSENLKVGICGVQLIQEDGQIARSCTRFPSVTNWVAHAVGLDRIFPGSAHRMANWDHDSSRVVDHVMGSFFLVRRVVFDALQGFDDRFFVYLEDLDFSKRAKALGWTSFYVADTRAFHAGGGTSRQVKAIRLFYSLRSRILYSIKHFSWFSALLILLATLIVEPCSRTVFAILKRSWSSLKETWCAYGMLYRWLPALSIKGR